MIHAHNDASMIRVLVCALPLVFVEVSLHTSCIPPCNPLALSFLLVSWFHVAFKYSNCCASWFRGCL
jgi:hypothetical protein